MSTLYVTGTPIGNLEDITLRQLRILGEVDFIAAEDTRVTRHLLSHFDLHTPLVSLHEHSSPEAVATVADRIAAGETCAVVSDAGMPCISDPGVALVTVCRARNIPVEVVPGPCAFVAALAISGRDTPTFTFEGFLPVQNPARRRRLESLQHECRPMIFYEAPHKLCRTLEDFSHFFGENRTITLCRELTKVHEQVQVMTLADACRNILEPRGEYVLILDGAPSESTSISLDDAVALAREKIAAGEKPSDACREIAAETGASRREIYAKIQQYGKGNFER